MAAVKKLNTTYTLDTTDVYISGNLHVTGFTNVTIYDTNTISVTNTDVADRTIALNVGETAWGVGGNAAPGQSGIIVDRGLQANVAIRWNEIYDNWELTTNGSGYSNIATSSSSGITAVVQDTSPRLGGNLITNGFNLQFQPLLTANPPTAVSGNAILYADTVGSAGSGLFVVNSGTASDELVTKSKAIVFSIIL
jgi:hypothetical protein